MENDYIYSYIFDKPIETLRKWLRDEGYVRAFSKFPLKRGDVCCIC
jgi:hypothetical protein